MDVSDGLVGDCDKLCAASGCSAMIEAEAVPLPPGLAGSGDAKLLARLLTAGEDFEILAAVSAENAEALQAGRASRRRPRGAHRNAHERCRTDESAVRRARRLTI